VAKAAGEPRDFTFRALQKPEEFRQAEELQREALGPEAALAVPAPLAKTVQDNGGIVLGAFADIYLAGAVVATLGWDGSILYQNVLTTVVRPEYQNHRVGFRLAAILREEVLRLGLGEVRWGVDPVHRPSASLSVRRLGARAEGYRANYFGQLAEPNGPRDESDRLRMRWPLADPTVERRLQGGVPAAEDDRARWSAASALVETEVGETGLRLPTAVSEPEGATAHLEIPFDLASIRSHEPGAVRRWRHAVRDAFRVVFDLGYGVDDFATLAIEHERRSFYLLSKPATPGPPAEPAER